MSESKQPESPPQNPAPASPQGGTSAPQETAPATAGSTPTEGPSQQEMAIRSALETVMDPEIGLSVIDLGLIREVHVAQDRTLIRMMLTTPFCPYAPEMMADVKQASQSVVPQETEVEILPDAWSPDMMPDPGLLGFSY
jgi:metal-sulfur cluster biosynthetic enzyme